MNKMIRTFLTLFALVGVLSACSSNPETEDTGTTDDVLTEQPTETPEPEPTANILDDVPTVFLFEFDQSILSSDARSALTIHAQVLRESPRSVRLEGHGDERGSREYNMALGERRANAVRDYLVLQGVDGSLIETVSYGEEQPAEVGSYESAWAQNRRVELK